MQLTTADADRVLRKLGCELVACRHHVRGFLTVDGKKVLAVHYSFGRKDMPGDVPHRFRRSLHLTLEEFNRLLGCTLSRDGYLGLLRTRGVVEDAEC
jgi:hypothetical protein